MDQDFTKIQQKNSSFISTKGGINWIHTALLSISPIIALYGLIYVRPSIYTIIFTVVLYFWTGLGITGGYHRLFSHRAYQARLPVKLFLLAGGTAAFEGSAKWWCRNHRAHHCYTDTMKDPYNAKRGFFYAHLGWMLLKQDAKNIGYADISDLMRDPFITFQHNYYGILSILLGIVMPTYVASLWGDVMGGYFYAAILRMVIVHHATFFVNSLAHHIGEKTFSDYHTACDSFITAILTLGEGYHNYHHEFPQDYRNAILFYQYDPTKWMISFFSMFGLTYNLKQTHTAEIERARNIMKEKKVKVEKGEVKVAEEPTLPHEITMDEFVRIVKTYDKRWTIIDGKIYDVCSFANEHPGGRSVLLNWIGKDASQAFKGTDNLYQHLHSQLAQKFLDQLRIDKVKLKTQ